jgi:hypothetical protein
MYACNHMSPRKLGGGSGLHPLGSVPAVLKGYRLAFNHRWGGLGGYIPCSSSSSGGTFGNGSMHAGSRVPES